MLGVGTGNRPRLELTVSDLYKLLVLGRRLSSHTRQNSCKPRATVGTEPDKRTHATHSCSAHNRCVCGHGNIMRNGSVGESLHSMWEALGLSPSTASNNNDSNYVDDDHSGPGGGTVHFSRHNDPSMGIECLSDTPGVCE